MYEPEAESDEDCEVYFLKPVNEYNIVDKIKEANKQLFALDNEQADDGNAVANDNPSNSNRKVTFALNLEDYEPTTQQGDSEQQQEEEEELPSPPEELLMKLAQLKLKPIAEEPAREQETSPEKPVPIPLEELSKEVIVVEEEEICEEILDLTEVDISKEMQPSTPATTTLPVSMDYEEDDFSGVDEDDLTAASETLATTTQQRRIARQNTFDLNNEQMEGESDQRSLTNLLTESDCEEDERAVNEARLKLRQAYKSLYKTLDANGQAQINRLTAGTDNQNDQDEAEAEEDDLSIIVASYIPDDFELDERSIYYKRDDTEEHKLRTSPNTNNISHTESSNCTSTKTFFNTRRFSFRRRARPTPSAPVPVVPDIKMNYKICCEHRNAMQDKLPRYTGYMSEYGLSARQLQQREKQLRRQQRFSMEQTLNRNEHEMRKMQDNERAFTTWLKNKMRYPINKTRNMFDASRRRASVAAVSGPKPEQHHQQHRSSRRRDSSEMHAYRHLLGSWNK